MNRDEFIDLLGRLVTDGVIDEMRALEILQAFDAGELPDGWQLPLPPAQGITGYDEADDEASLLFLAIALGIRIEGEFLPKPRTIAQVTREANKLQTAFERQVRKLATDLANGDLTVVQWQERMISATRQNLINQVRLGSGRATLTLRQITRVDELMVRQTAFIQRFADSVSAGRGGEGAALSEAQIGARSSQYGGFARGEMFRQYEGAESYGDGWVIQYIARDDDATCGPCSRAAYYGPYLPGDGPMPGEVCLGRQSCRCERRPVYNMAAWRDMVGI